MAKKVYFLDLPQASDTYDVGPWDNVDNYRAGVMYPEDGWDGLYTLGVGVGNNETGYYAMLTTPGPVDTEAGYGSELNFDNTIKLVTYYGRDDGLTELGIESDIVSFSGTLKTEAYPEADEDVVNKNYVNSVTPTFTVVDTTLIVGNAKSIPAAENYSF